MSPKTTYAKNMSQKSKNDNILWVADKPYQDLPKLPPSNVDLESKAILKKCVTARTALAELKKAAELIPNQGMLISILPKLEAKASSEIESIITTTDRLFQFVEIEERADPATKEALRYSRALMEGHKSLAKYPINARMAEAICSTIKDVEMTVRKVPGTQLRNDKSGEIIYTPPEGEGLLRDLLDNWAHFLNEKTEIDPLVRMAVCHYQFEAIHPFSDGNGRTGRAINSLFLIQENLLNLPVLFLSRYIIQNKKKYYELLLKVTQQESWEEWILFVLDGVEVTAKWTTDKIEAIRELMRYTSEYIQQRAHKIYSHELASLIFELPYCRINNLTGKGLVGRQAASRYLKELVKIGVLREESVGREKIFIHPKLIHLLKDEKNKIIPYFSEEKISLGDLGK